MKLKIGGKLFIGFGLVIALTVALTFFSFLQFKSVDVAYTNLIDNETVEVTKVREVLSEAKKLVIAASSYLYSGGNNYLSEYDNAKDQLNKKLSLIKIEDSKDSDSINKIQSFEKEFIAIADKMIALKQAKQDYSRLAPAAESATKGLVNSISEYITYKQTHVDDGHKAVQGKVTTSGNTIIIVTLIIVGAAVFIAGFNTRIITKPLGQLDQAAKHIADGDLSKPRVKILNEDETGQLSKSFNIMTTNLKKLIVAISSSSEQLASSAQQLTESAEQTSCAATESANSVTEMAHGIQQIATNVQEVAQATLRAEEIAKEGSRGVEAAILQINKIEETVAESADLIKELGLKSASITQIVELITLIAGQTNLLALNAAIEAARAGEQGKGFAVVAEEVRKLAEQSANAAKEITGLITQIQTETNNAVRAMAKGTAEVSHGAKVTLALDKNFKGIMENVQGLSLKVQEVSGATQQMAAGVENVAASSQQQTASMEEVTASAEELTNMAGELHSLIYKFKL